MLNRLGKFLWQTLSIAAVIAGVTCSPTEPQIFERDNPYDAGGDDWRLNAPPVVSIARSTKTQWVAFDSAAGSGTVAFQVVVTDPNQSADTVRLMVEHIKSADETDSLYPAGNSEIEIAGIKPGAKFFCRVNAFDSFDSVGRDTATLRAPAAAPPAFPREFRAEYVAGTVAVQWVAVAKTQYRLYRGGSTGSEQVVQLDTTIARSGLVELAVVASSSALAWYRVASYNEYGENRSALCPAGPTSQSVYSGAVAYPLFTDSAEVTVVLTGPRQTGADSITSLDLYRAQSNAGPFVYRGNVAWSTGDTAYYRDSASAKTKWYYSVQPVTFKGLRGSRSLPQSTDALIAATSLTAEYSSSGEKAYLKWQSLLPYNRYIVYRKTSSYSSFGMLDTAVTQVYVDSLGNLSTYSTYYAVVGLDYFGKSGLLSHEATLRPYTLLSAPSAVNASYSNESKTVLVSWNKVNNATGYAVFASTTYSGSYTRIENTSATQVSVPVKVSGTWYFKVAAFRADSILGTYSYVDDITIAGLNAPVVSATRGTHREYIEVNWAAVAGAKQYYLFRTSIDSSFSLLAIPFDTLVTTAYRDSVKTSAEFAYRVAAVDSTGMVGAVSSAAIGRIWQVAAPAGFGTRTQTAAIELYWQSAPGAASYQIYRGSSCTAPQLYASGITDYRWLDTLVAGPSTRYYYQVAALDSLGRQGVRSSCADAVPTALSYPGNVSASLQLYRDTVRVWWRSAPAARAYRVFRSTLVPAIKDSFALVTDTFFIDTTVRAGQTFRYVVATVNGSQQSGLSAPATGMPLSHTPGVTARPTLSSLDTIVQVTWNEPPTSQILGRADGYCLYRSYGSDGAEVLVDTVYETSYYDTVSVLGAYSYTVLAFNTIGPSRVRSDPGSIIVAPFGAPASLNASDYWYGDRVELSWSPVEGVEHYIVYRSRSSSFFLYAPIDTVADTAFADMAVFPDSLYYYRVVGYLPQRGVGPQSSTQLGRVIPRPREPTVIESSSGIVVNWERSVAVLTNTLLYKSNSSLGPFVVVDTLSGLTYNDTTATIGYAYYAVSYFNKNAGVRSSAVRAHRLPPLAPLGIVASQGVLVDSIRISWQAVSGAQGYRLYRSHAADFSLPQLIADSADTLFLDTAGSDGVRYYRVKAWNVIGESVLGAQTARGYRAPQSEPLTPVQLTASDTSQHIIVTWQQPSQGARATGYRVYRAESEQGAYALVDSVETRVWYDPVPLSYPATYWYRVEAYNGLGSSALAEPVEGYRN